ncbi:Immunoglobulin Superfamily Containing Leucine-Rich Repeat Protein [Manis pentadactyla]|nr:Immunoglobulin Superfamily Containing Leucine-Rich Repeat Protein [Manis pentadactyla]
MMHQSDGRPRRRSALGLPGRRARGTHGRRSRGARLEGKGSESEVFWAPNGHRPVYNGLDPHPDYVYT